MASVEREMSRYYDDEVGREARQLDHRRVAARSRFAALAESPVLEIGTGPGIDATALRDLGLQVLGVDLSKGHAGRAASRGVTVAVATARALPFATGSIASMWSMSTLMHVPAAAIEATVGEIRRVLVPGAPVAIGVWGGPDVEHYDTSGGDDPSRPKRLFSRVSEPRWRSLLERIGTIDHFEVWTSTEADQDAFRYHLAFLTRHR